MFIECTTGLDLLWSVKKMDQKNDAKQHVVLAVEERTLGRQRQLSAACKRIIKLKQPHLNVAPDKSVLNHDCIESYMYHVNFLDMIEKT